MAKRVTTLFIRDTGIHLLVMKGGQIEKWASSPLEPGLVSQGLIVDEAQVAERIRQSVENYRFRAYDEIIAMTISIGVATYPHDGDDIAALIDHADQALYRAKAEGRNKVIPSS